MSHTVGVLVLLQADATTRVSAAVRVWANLPAEASETLTTHTKRTGKAKYIV
jgi:hypothetical protein